MTVIDWLLKKQYLFKEYGINLAKRSCFHYLLFIISSRVTIRRQQNYHLFFCGWGDNTLISNLNKMFYSGKGNILMEAIKILSKTVKNPYDCYLLLDTHPNSPFKSSMRLRTNIFDKEYPYFLMTDEDWYENSKSSFKTPLNL